ncbi:energy-coupling factor transporter transmembrane protein EcfT [Candidatus Phytoplasma rubi]|uniref:Energy-coupling factor transporter transmembrane protein EcfT n=1 Tax=Candidatus Phytoplasma rubi TaxID=399025 RepID=A0ABY7BT70_9MOLU|nr:energy-coupling factor transporter transmembrane component T [Candidatus Phytoplasma rubi]WAN63513.1 energy-coupling factor transporter transmembrane protein EcfT [Candidatus Phytoplasma rubi]
MEIINIKNKSFLKSIHPSLKIILFILIFKIIFSLNLDLNAKLTLQKQLFYFFYFIFFIFIFVLLFKLIDNFFIKFIRQILNLKFFFLFCFFLHVSPKEKEFSFSIFPNDITFFFIIILFLYFLSFFLIKNEYKNIYFLIIFFFVIVLPSILQFSLNQDFFLKLYFDKKDLLNIFFIFLRICLFFMLNFLINQTTSFIEIKDGLEILLKPLKIIKFPVEIFSLMISLILMSIPFLLEESKKILKAQISRGLNFYTKNIFKKVYYLISLLIPILILAFKKSFVLANAMETRGYVLGKPRTKLNVFQITKKDYFIFCFIFVFFVWSFFI